LRPPPKCTQMPTRALFDQRLPAGVATDFGVAWRSLLVKRTSTMLSPWLPLLRLGPIKRELEAGALALDAIGLLFVEAQAGAAG
jgi:hypothetical protein